MGSKALMRVVNSRSIPVTTVITNVVCMYDNGEENSNLSLFNNATVPPGGAVPEENGQFIESKSGLFSSCLTTPSTFTLTVNSPTRSIGSVTINTSGSPWKAVRNSNPFSLIPTIDNTAPQCPTILLTITP